MPGKFSYPALRGCPAQRRGEAEEHSAMLAQTWLSLTRGCCYLLGPKVWQPGAAGEEVGTGTGSAYPGFCGLPKAAEHRQKLAMGCRGVGLVPGGCLGQPVAILRVMLWGWASSAGKPMLPCCHRSFIPGFFCKAVMMQPVGSSLLPRERCSMGHQSLHKT